MWVQADATPFLSAHPVPPQAFAMPSIWCKHVDIYVASLLWTLFCESAFSTLRQVMDTPSPTLTPITDNDPAPLWMATLPCEMLIVCWIFWDFPVFPTMRALVDMGRVLALLFLTRAFPASRVISLEILLKATLELPSSSFG